MQLLFDWQSFPTALRGGVLCVGSFDGVHVGHARMLSVGREEATRRKVPFTIMTFEPHPIAILKPSSPVRLLSTLDQRKELLAAFNPDVLMIVPTTREFLGMPADSFLKDVVAGALGITLMVEGPTFTYGKSAKGTPEELRARGPALGIQAIIVPTQEVVLSDLSVVNVSSTLIRWLNEQGRVRDAAKCLGRPYTLRGQVIEGQKRGRSIGFPTANLAVSQLAPGDGVYGGHARLPGTSQKWKAAISVGTNPTFDGKTRTVEAFLLDFDADLYGKTVDLSFEHWVREMISFGGVAPLVEQMKRDVAEIALAI